MTEPIARIVTGIAHPSGESYTAALDPKDRVVAIHWGVECPDHEYLTEDQYMLDEPVDMIDIVGRHTSGGTTR